jgi:hypothetical protein
MNRHTKFILIGKGKGGHPIQLVALIGKNTKKAIALPLDVKQAVQLIFNNKFNIWDTLANTREEKLNIFNNLMDSMFEPEKNLIIDAADLNESRQLHRGISINMTPSCIILDDQPSTTKKQTNRNKKLKWKESINRKLQNITTKKMNLLNKKHLNKKQEMQF